MSPQRAGTHAGVPHSFTNDSVTNYLRRRLDGVAWIEESHPITLDNSEPEPDIAVVRLPNDIYKQHHPYPQDIYWLIEVSNRTIDKDLKEKTVTYARNGIPEYWVIDLPHNKLWVFTQPSSQGYSQTQEFTRNISPLAFPNVAIAVNNLLLY